MACVYMQDSPFQNANNGKSGSACYSVSQTPPPRQTSLAFGSRFRKPKFRRKVYIFLFLVVFPSLLILLGLLQYFGKVDVMRVYRHYFRYHITVRDAKVVLVTRYWGETDKDLEHLHRFLTAPMNHQFGEIIVLINTDRDKTDAVNALKLADLNEHNDIHVLPISPWEGITPPLNAALKFVEEKVTFKPNYILFASPEIRMTYAAIDVMLRSMDGDTLVVGAALPGHIQPEVTSDGRVSPYHQNAVVPLTGATCPWNTLALWNYPMLRETGFSPVADKVNPPGMEEVAVIAEQQAKYSWYRRKAVLMAFFRSGKNTIGLFTEWDSQDRQMAHMKKMKSKTTRAAAILEMMGKLTPKVQLVFVPS